MIHLWHSESAKTKKVKLYGGKDKNFLKKMNDFFCMIISEKLWTGKFFCGRVEVKPYHSGWTGDRKH